MSLYLLFVLFITICEFYLLPRLPQGGWLQSPSFVFSGPCLVFYSFETPIIDPHTRPRWFHSSHYLNYALRRFHLRCVTSCINDQLLFADVRMTSNSRCFKKWHINRLFCFHQASPSGKRWWCEFYVFGAAVRWNQPNQEPRRWSIKHCQNLQKIISNSCC